MVDGGKAFSLTAGLFGDPVKRKGVVADKVEPEKNDFVN